MTADSGHDEIDDLVDWQLRKGASRNLPTRTCSQCRTRWTGHALWCPECRGRAL